MSFRGMKMSVRIHQFENSKSINAYLPALVKGEHIEFFASRWK